MSKLDDPDFCIEKYDDNSVRATTTTNMNSHYEIFYITNGQKKYFINNSLYKVETGDAMLVSEGDISHDRSELLDAHKTSAYYALKFSSHFLDETLNMLSSDKIDEVFNYKKINIPPEKRAHFENLLTMIFSEYADDTDSFSETLIRLYFSQLLILLIRCAAPLSENSDNSHEEHIEAVCRHICNYYNEQLTLGDMAKLAYMSPTYFSKKFKKVTGFGFNEYLNNIRIKIAINMLVNTKHSITEIAVYCGYQDSNYFGDVFRRIVGVSPSKYRKTHH